MMKKLISLLLRSTPLGKIVMGVSLVAVIAGVVFVASFVKTAVQNEFNARFVAPAVTLAIEPLNTAIIDLQADTAQLNEALQWQIKENELFADSIALIATERTQTVEALQRTIQQIESRRKALKQENAQLAKGVRVDLVTKTYRDRVFGKDKVVDSTYQVGWKWGLE